MRGIAFEAAPAEPEAADHSPLPWTPTYSWGLPDQIRAVTAADGSEVKVMGFPLTGSRQAAANSVFIVRACNAHGDMLEALRVTSATLKMLTAPNVIQTTSVGDAWIAAVKAEAKVRTAIATAEGR